MPNKNSWLSFTINYNTLDNINDINHINFDKYDIDITNIKTLHMTCVFMGKALQGKQITLLQQVNSLIKTYKQQLNDINITLKFDKYMYLPKDCQPNKRKLLVAVYKTNKKLNEWNLSFRKELIKLGFCNYDDEFLAHITIGRIIHNKNSIEINIPDNDKLNKLGFIKYPDLILSNLQLDGIQNKYINKIY